MEKVKIIKLLLILAFVPGLLVGCKPGTNAGNGRDPDANTNSEAITKAEAKNLADSFNQLEAAHNKFQSSLEEFLTDTKNVADKSQSDKQSVDTKTPNDKLVDLLTASNKFNDTLNQSDSELPTSLGAVSNNINTTIKDIQKVTDPLKEGLVNKDTVLEVQKYLDVLNKHNVQKQFHGMFGPTTQKEVEQFLTQKNSQLVSEITKLKQIIGKIVPPTPTPSLSPAASPPSFDKNLKALSDQVRALEQQNNDLTDQVKNLSDKIEQSRKARKTTEIGSSLLFVVVIAGIAIWVTLKLRKNPKVIGRWIHKFTSSQEVRDHPPSSPTNQRGSTQSPYLTNDDAQELFRNLNYQLRQELSTQSITPSQFTSLVTRLENLEQASRIDYQDNLSSQQRQLPYQDNLSSQPTQLPYQDNLYSQQTQASRVFPQQPPTQRPSKNPPANLSAAELMIRDYNANPASLSQKATIVSETDESIEQRRLGRNLAPILEENRRGDYWILTSGSSNYLIPKSNIRINEYNYKTVESLFECDVHQQGDFSNLRLIEPAEVVPITSGKEWKLTKLGIIEFT
ncbi:MAG: hypothetical protein F6K31_13435 [Symploca sp. SIO2G7]|nr:hypothetical protein [Symploca sp. SIO2G7]